MSCRVRRRAINTAVQINDLSVPLHPPPPLPAGGHPAGRCPPTVTRRRPVRRPPSTVCLQALFTITRMWQSRPASLNVRSGSRSTIFIFKCTNILQLRAKLGYCNEITPLRVSHPNYYLYNARLPVESRLCNTFFRLRHPNITHCCIGFSTHVKWITVSLYISLNRRMKHLPNDIPHIATNPEHGHGGGGAAYEPIKLFIVFVRKQSASHRGSNGCRDINN